MKTYTKFTFKSRKSQAEIIGITIVMVLIMLGIVFVIKYILLPQDERQLKDVYESTQRAANFIDSLLKTTTSCNKISLTQLIQNCVEFYDQPNFQYTCNRDIVCQEEKCLSCDYLNKTIKYILNQSLESMNKRYDFFICRWDDINKNCMASRNSDIITYLSYRSCIFSNTPVDIEAKQSPIPTSLGNRVVIIYIC